MVLKENVRSAERWGQFCFSVIGTLLAAPPEKGQLSAALSELAQRTWKHPITGQAVTFSLSTIKRWYYRALEGNDPVGGLRRKQRLSTGCCSMTDKLREALLAQYAAHKSWSVDLHYGNLIELAQKHPEVGEVPSYSTVLRFMRSRGLNQQRKVNARHTPGALAAEARLGALEVRSYEVEHVGGLWHWDYHHGSLDVLTEKGLRRPLLLAFLDDYSRHGCHAQWYLDETAENVVHGLMQAMQKRGLPRAAMSDNGSPMIAREVSQGLGRLGIIHETTLPYSPYQNGKQERFWGQVEGRLLAMLEGVRDLTLARLNEATQAWIEYEYNCRLHKEIGTTPIDRFLNGPDVSRPCPDTEALKFAFTRTEVRRVRRTDGTVSIQATRFEVPNCYRHLQTIEVRYASWDLSLVHMVDQKTGAALCRLYPVNKAANSTGMRRSLDPISNQSLARPDGPDGMPPLLARLIEKRSATGLPPAYLTKDEDK